MARQNRPRNRNQNRPNQNRPQGQNTRPNQSRQGNRPNQRPANRPQNRQQRPTAADPLAPWHTGFRQYNVKPNQLGDFLRAGGSYSSLDPDYNDPALMSALLGLGGFQGNLDSQLGAALTNQAFGAVDRYRNNLTGGTQNPATTSSSFALDDAALQRIIGNISGDLAAGRDPAARFAAMQSMTPGWASGVFNDLTGGSGLLQQLHDRSAGGSGLDFDLSYLASPGINLTDPSKMLFEGNQTPGSLFPAIGNQAGERAFAQTTSAEEFMRELLPRIRAYNNRPAGAPAATSGLTFGSYDEGTGGVGSPLQQTDPYLRWTAYGQPGNDYGPFEGVHGISRDVSYNPFTNTGQYSGQAGKGANSALVAGLLGGSFKPEYIQNDSRNTMLSLLGRIGAAAYYQDPSIWFAGPYAPYSPDQIGADAYARLLAAAGLQGQNQPQA